MKTLDIVAGARPNFMKILVYQTERLGSASLGSSDLKKRLQRYGVVTLHRASNVDDPATLARLVRALGEVSRGLPLIFPVHPRTRARLNGHAADLGPGVCLTPPLSYMEFLNLWRDATLTLTDSGGLQEETTALGVPCVTLRENTERPITVKEGTNVPRGEGKRGRRPELWDGRAAERIVEVLQRELH